VVHDLNLAARFADHIVLLNDGIVAEGTASEVLTTDLIQPVFGIRSTLVPTPDSNFHLIFG
jgi:iron complex transport system ATP-binding protein